MLSTRERLLGGLTATVTAIAVGVVLAGPSRAETVVTYTAIDRSSNYIPGNNANPRSQTPAQGDMFAIDEVLKNQAGQTVGYDSGTCVVTNTGGLAHCTVTGALPGGSITVQGIINFNRDTFVLAITGGTGRFNGAGGWLEGRNVNDTTTTLTFHFP